jgi:TM2 domain-containing membrane protein YozV
MKKHVIFLLLAFFGLAAQSNASAAYTLNDEAIEAVFESAVEVSAVASLPVANVAEGQSVLATDPSPAVAFVLSWFLGGLGAHRWYLGTDTSTKILYCITLGGCGILWTVDTVLLLIGLINNDISKYANNDSFIMW